MPAFSYDQQYLSLLVDSVSFPFSVTPLITNKLPSILDAEPNSMANFNSSSHCKFHYDKCERNVVEDIGGGIDVISPSEKIENEHSVMTEKRSSVEQLTPENHGRVSMMKKRKAEKGSSSSNFDANSKDSRARKGKRQKGTNQVESEKQLGADKRELVAEEAPTGYIHVRARRGEATDSHSLAERVRREKISERMKMLQALVPGCDKVTGKALMLDEIINYVQSLQHQVEFLSRKLVCVDSIFGADVEGMMLESQGISRMQLPLQPSTTTMAATLTQQCHNCTPFSSAPQLTTTALSTTVNHIATNTFSSSELGSTFLDDVISFPPLDAGQMALQIPTQETVEVAGGSSFWETGDQRQCCFIHESTGYDGCGPTDYNDLLLR
ncbi:hypothetical protein Droror1_Dr00012579 [Drosera rotundifolia]